MNFVYAVRCNFSRPDLLERWHAWYSGPKLAEMMTHPLFLSGQRYQAAGLDRTIEYLALWVVESPDAFTTPEYKASWGFAEWKPHITHWSRNLYRAPEGVDMTARLDVAPGGGLYLAAFDDVAEPESAARCTGLRAARPDVIWMEVAGLDRSVPAVGVAPLPDVTTPPPSLPPPLAAGIRQTVFRPITERRRAKATAG